MSLVTYALPSWGGFVSAELISMIDGMLRRLRRFGYLKDSIKFQDLLDRYDEELKIYLSACPKRTTVYVTYYPQLDI